MRLPLHKSECCVLGEDKEFCLCQNSLKIDLVSRKWTLLILWLLAKYGRLRFTDIKRKLVEVNPQTLSIRLDELEEAGLISKTRFKEIPPRVEYSLTPEGEELSRLTKPLLNLTVRGK